MTACITYFTLLEHPSEHSNSTLQRTTQQLLSILIDRRDTNPLGKFIPMSDQFVSFLADSSTTSPFSGIGQSHEELAALCLNILFSELRFNICNIPSSFLRNRDVKNLASLAEAKISRHLRYACCYWMHHVARIPNVGIRILDKISQFLQHYFLFWLEVTSFLNFPPKTALGQLSLMKVCNLCIYIAPNTEQSINARSHILPHRWILS